MKRALAAFVAVFCVAFAGLVAAFAVLVVAATIAHADPSSSTGPGQYGVSITSVTSLTVPVGSVSAMICVQTASARYTDDGTTPTASIGIPVAAGQCFAYTGPLTAFRIIGAGATIDVRYFN